MIGVMLRPHNPIQSAVRTGPKVPQGLPEAQSVVYGFPLAIAHDPVEHLVQGAVIWPKRFGVRQLAGRIESSHLYSSLRLL